LKWFNASRVSEVASAQTNGGDTPGKKSVTVAQLLPQMLPQAKIRQGRSERFKLSICFLRDLWLRDQLINSQLLYR